MPARGVLSSSLKSGVRDGVTHLLQSMGAVSGWCVQSDLLPSCLLPGPGALKGIGLLATCLHC